MIVVLLVFGVLVPGLSGVFSLVWGIWPLGVLNLVFAAANLVLWIKSPLRRRSGKYNPNLP